MSNIVKGIRAKYGTAIDNLSDEQIALAYLRKHPEITKDKKYESAAAELVPLAKVTDQGKISSDVSGIGREFAKSVGTSVSALARHAEDNRQDLPLVAPGGGLPFPTSAFRQQYAKAQQTREQRAQRTGEQQAAATEASPLAQYGRSIEQSAEQLMPSNPLYTHRTRAKVGEALGGTLPTIGASAISPGAAAMQYGLMAGEGQAREAIMAGAYDDAYGAMYLGTVTGAATELALGVPSKVFKILRAAHRSGVKPMGLGKWVLDTFGKQSLKEIAQENAENAINNKFAKETYDPERKIFEGWRETSKISGILGATIGGSANIGRMSMERKARLQSIKQERDARVKKAAEDMEGVQLPDGNFDMTENDVMASIPPQLHPLVRVAPDGEGLPQSLRDEYDGDAADIDGGFDPNTGEVWLNRARMTSPEVVADKVIHEVAIHKGLHNALGPEAVAELGRRTFKSLAVKDIAELDKLGYTQNEGESTSDYEARAGEEWIARKAEEVRKSGKPDAAWAKMAAEIRKWLRALGFDTKLSDLEVAELMEQGLSAAQAEVDAKLSAEAQAKPQQPKLSAGPDAETGVRLGNANGLEFQGNAAGREGWLQFHDPVTGTGIVRSPKMSETDFANKVQEIRESFEVDTPAAPATFVGLQQYPPSMNRPPMELFNLTEDIEGHEAGSTVSRETLERAGFSVPEHGKTRLSVSKRGPEIPKNLWDAGKVKQEITSADTSINSAKPSAIVKQVAWKRGSINADIGGGRHNKTSQELAKRGVDNVIFDPFNRTPEENAQAAKRLAGGKADTATVSSVLNVIKEPENRQRVLLQAYDALKPGGEAFILIHEGNGDGNSGESPKGWQEHRKADTYLPEVSAVFPEAEQKGNMIVARKHDKTGLAPRLSASARISETPLVEGGRVSPAFPTGQTIRVADPLQENVEIDYRNMSDSHKKAAADLIVSYPQAKVNPKGTPEAVVEQAIEQMTDNLVWLFNGFEWKDRARHWYAGANRLANMWAQRYKITPAQVAGVMAGLSPKNPWFDNLTQAERVMDIYHEHRFTPWSDAMEKQAKFRYAKDGKSNKKWKAWRDIRGKTIDQIQREFGEDSDFLVAAWIRMYDEVNLPRHKRVSIPEGDFINKLDSSRMGWGGGIRPIAVAVGMLRDGRTENISALLGKEHKVRNFFNNILSPLSPFDITIDTHAVGAAWLLPVGQSDTVVSHNFGGKGSSTTGTHGYSGLYAIYHEAYRRAAKIASDATGQKILPREMQSVTWEAAKSLFSPEFKRPQKTLGGKTEAGLAKAERIWKQYATGKITIDQARDQVAALDGGFTAPAWAGIEPGSRDSGTDTTRGSTYKGQLYPVGTGREGAEPGGGKPDSRRAKVKLSATRESDRARRLKLDPRTDPKVVARMNGLYKQFSFEQSAEGAKLIVQKAGGHVEAAQAYLRGDFGDAEFMSRFILEEIQDGLRAQIIALRNRNKSTEAGQIAELQLQVTDADIAQASKAGQLLAAHRIHYARWSPETWVRRYRQVVGDIAKNRLRKAAHTDAVDNSPTGQAQIIANEVADIIGKQEPKVAEAIRRAFGKNANPATAEQLPQSVVDVYMAEVEKYRKKHGIPKFDAATEASIREQADSMLKLPDDSIQRREASGELMTNILNQGGVNWWDMVMDYWYGNILSGPTTQVKNARGNLANLVAETAFQMMTNPTAIFQIMEGMGRGAVAGGREAVNIWRTGVDTSGRSGNKFETPGAFERVRNPAMSKVLLPWKVVMRTLKAVDMMFYYPLQEGRAVVLARHEAKKDGVPVTMRGRYARELLGWEANARRDADAQVAEEGLTGQLAKRRAREILEQRRPPILMRNAREYGLQGTYQNDMYGVLGSLGREFQKAATRSDLRFLRLIVPFISVPVNLTNSMLNWTPVGYYRGTVPAVKLLMAAPQGQKLGTAGKIAKGTMDLPKKGVHMYGKELTDQLAIRDAMAKATVGTAVWMGLAYAAAAFMDDDDPFFAIFGRGPMDAQKNETWREAGYRAYSVKIGDHILTYNDTPAMVPLAIIGGIMDSFRYGQMEDSELMTRVQVAMVSSFGVFMDSTWLQSLGSLWEAKDRISPKRPFKGAFTQAANIASGAIPLSGAGRQIDMIMDPSKGTEIDFESMLLSRVPFARRLNKPDLNVLGEPIEVGPFDQFYKKITDDQLIRLLAQRKLWPSVPDIGHLTPEEHYALLEARAPLMREMLESPDVQEFLRDSPQFMAETIVRSLSSAATKVAAANTGLQFDIEARKMEDIQADIYDWQRSRQ